MAVKKEIDVQKEIDNLVAELGKAKTDEARYKVTLKFLKFPHDEVVDYLIKAFKSQPELRWVFPSVLNKLAEKNLPGVQEALGNLLTDKKAVVRANAARVIAEHGWADAYVDELLKLAEKENPPGPCLAALEALITGTSETVFEGLMTLAARPLKNPWRRGNVLEGLANHRRPEARPVFERALRKDEEQPFVKLMAACGLAHLGDRSALDILRQGLDFDDLGLSTAAAGCLHELLSTPDAYSKPQVERLRKWWDKHPTEVEARFEKFKKKHLTEK
jgi:HEAT repeat protein